MTLGQYVRTWREQQRPRLTIRALCERMVATGHTTGVTEAWISLLENDRLNVAGIGNDKLRALAAVMGETVDSLLVAAGLGGAHPTDELTAWHRLCAEAEAVGVPLGTVNLYRQGYADAPHEVQQGMAADLARLVAAHRALQEDAAHPLPKQAPTQEPGTGGVQTAAHARPRERPRTQARAAVRYQVHEERGDYCAAGEG